MADLDHTHDDESRAAITAAAEAIARVLIGRKLWRAPWRVEVDGCVFKFKIEGYPKKGTPHWHERERERAALDQGQRFSIADDTVRVHVGDCTSSIAHAVCRFAAGAGGEGSNRRLKCGAPQAAYEACRYSAHRNPVVPVFGKDDEPSRND